MEEEIEERNIKTEVILLLGIVVLVAYTLTSTLYFITYRGAPIIFYEPSARIVLAEIFLGMFGLAIGVVVIFFGILDIKDTIKKRREK